MGTGLITDVDDESLIDAARDVGTMPWQPELMVADIPCITHSLSNTTGMSNRTAGRDRHAV